MSTIAAASTDADGSGSLSEEISKLKGLLEKLPGKENARRRKAINKKIQKLNASAGNGAGGDDEPAVPSTQKQSEPIEKTPPRRKNKQKKHVEPPASPADVADSPEKSPTRQSRGQPSPFKVMRKPGGGTIVRVLDHELKPHEYRRLGRAGKGSFATCYEAVCLENDATVCLKMTDLCAKKIDTVDVRDELDFLRRLHHPNCLSLFGFSVDVRLIVTMVVEFCPYSLEDIRVACDKNESIRTRIHPTLARKCMSQVIAGVEYLHNFSAKEAIAHFDIKPDNVMSTPEGVLKIADFGLAVALSGKDGLVTDGMYRGTDEYMAPEVSAGSDSPYGLPADIWSLGVTFYELLFGRLCKPERESFSRRLMEAIGKSGFCDLEPADAEIETADGTANFHELLIILFSKTFTKDPAKRASIERLVSDPLFDFSPDDVAESVVKEIKVVETLKAARTRARREYSKRGALADLELESSSESESSESSEEEDDGDSESCEEIEDADDSVEECADVDGDDGDTDGGEE